MACTVRQSGYVQVKSHPPPPPHPKNVLHYDACVWKCTIYGSETWAMKSSSVERIEKAEMRMVRWMCRTSLCERKKNEDFLQSMHLVRIGQVMRKSRLRWYGHVARREETHWLQRILDFPVAGRNPHGRVGDPTKHGRHQSQKTEERLILPTLTQLTGKHGEQPSRK